MGSIGTKIIGMDAGELIELLNKALADEWLATYQYWVGAKVIKGPLRSAAEAELLEHAQEEQKHANMLAKRIIELGGTPLLDPKEWIDRSNCGYEAPQDPHVLRVVEQNIAGERCAIMTYKKILDRLKDADDPITFNMIRKIMEDEVEHEDDLEALKEDIELMKQ